MSALIGQYDPPWSFSSGGITHDVYSAGQGTPVLVLHELPGMVEECLELGLILARDFRVHMPLLFGKPGQSSSVGNLLRIFCVSREIHLFSTRGPGPLLDWARALCRKLKADAGVPGVGVIGMCLTGGFALALVADDSVLAPVVAQASLPLLQKAPLGLSEADAKAVQARAAALGPDCVLGLRYAGDRIAPAEKIETIKELIGPAFDYAEFAGDDHATLTVHRHPQALARTVAFLRQRLA